MDLPPLPIVVLACRVFQGWLDQLLPPGQAAQVTFLDYGLHRLPKNLRQTLQAALDGLEQPSLVVLGYGLCGNGLHKLHAGRHTLLVPRTDDCIAIILGSYAAYREQFEREPATYYLSKGWLEGGSTPLQEHADLAAKYGAHQADWIMDTQYHNYRRLALIVQDLADLHHYRPAAQEVAAYCARWGLRYEELVGSDALLRRLVELAAGLASDHHGVHAQVGKDFVVVPPGGVLSQEQFIR